MTKILLVEDDKSLREIYGVRLLAEGYDIVSAGDGEDALAMAIKERPQLIISDVMMPKISGFDMLDILRSTTETRDIKVIMMTALSSEDQRQRGEQLGADRYLVKSQVGIEDVVRTVHEVLDDQVGITSASATATQTPVAAPAPVSAPAPTTDDVAQPTTTTPDPVSSDDTLGAAAPGNDGAGPLPPQPSESALPQPTAPFSSPRPTNLGERVIQPLSVDADPNPDAPVAPEESAHIATELQATADPIASTQVDEAISDADVATEGPANTVPTPVVEPLGQPAFQPTFEETGRPQPAQPYQNPPTAPTV